MINLIRKGERGKGEKGREGSFSSDFLFRERLAFLSQFCPNFDGKLVSFLLIAPRFCYYDIKNSRNIGVVLSLSE